MKAFELRRLEPYSRLNGQQLMDLVKCCRELTIAAGRRFEVRASPMRGQCFLIEGSVQLCVPGLRHPQILENIDHRDPRARRPLLSAEVPDVHILTRSRSRILVVDTEVKRRSDSVYVTPIGTTDKSTWMKVFLGGALTAQLAPSALRDLFREFESEEVTAGQIIGKIGESSSRFHIIKTGQARIANQVTLAVLGPGEFFGEDSLIRGSTRNANISMMTNGELLSIGETAFRELLRSRFVRHLAAGMVSVRTNLVSESNPESDSAELNIRLENLRSSLHLFDRDIRYLLCGNEKDVELAAFILTHHGYQAFVRQHGQRDSYAAS